MGRPLNRGLVRGGWAWWYDAYAKFDGELKRLEDEARATRRGLWRDKSPIPPWDWRKGGAAVQAAGFIGNSKSQLYHAANCNAAAKMTASQRAAFKPSPIRTSRSGTGAASSSGVMGGEFPQMGSHGIGRRGHSYDLPMSQFDS